jgi:hypothetical protein
MYGQPKIAAKVQDRNPGLNRSLREIPITPVTEPPITRRIPFQVLETTVESTFIVRPEQRPDEGYQVTGYIVDRLSAHARNMERVASDAVSDTYTFQGRTFRFEYS